MRGQDCTERVVAWEGGKRLAAQGAAMVGLTERFAV
jgi:hypothetical protein